MGTLFTVAKIREFALCQLPPPQKIQEAQVACKFCTLGSAALRWLVKKKIFFFTQWPKENPSPHLQIHTEALNRHTAS